MIRNDALEISAVMLSKALLLLARLLEKLPDDGQQLFGFVAVEVFFSHEVS